MKGQLVLDTAKRRFKMRPAQTILLGFVGVILFGAFLLSMPISSKEGVFTPFIDALFTSTSAVCVTGLTVFPTAMYFSGFGQAVILLLVQIGGLGFMTATTFIMLIMRRKISYKSRLTIQNSLSLDSAKGIIKLVRAILLMTLITEILGCLILMPFFVKDNGAIGVWQAVFTSVSAFCNSGFDLFSVTGNESISLAGYRHSPVVLLTIALLVIIGGLGFTVVADVFNKKFKYKKLSLHSKVALSVTLGLLVFSTLFFLVIEYNNPGTIGNDKFFSKLLASFFEAASIRTAGFSIFEQNALRLPSKFLSGILMFIGASPGSTGGGVKTTSFALLVLAIIAIFRGRDYVITNKHTISSKMLLKSVTIIFTGIFLVCALTMIVLIAEQNNTELQNLGIYNIGSILYDSISAFSTTGFSTSLTAALSPVSKFATMVTMFLGRVGFINLGFAFFNSEKPDIIRYPEGNIMIG